MDLAPCTTPTPRTTWPWTLPTYPTPIQLGGGYIQYVFGGNMCVCNVCRTEKQEDEFATSPGTGKRVKICLVCWGIHYAHLCKSVEHHREKKRKESDRARNRNREYVYKVLSESCCLDCGYSNWLALQFDHRDPIKKVTDVCILMNMGVALGRLKVEIEKCDVVCANCHTIRTMKVNNSWRIRTNESQ